MYNFVHFYIPFFVHSYFTINNSLLPNLYFKFEYLSNILRVLFPFKYPIKLDILILGGISTNICTWSLHVSPFIIFTPLNSHNCLSIFPIFFFTFPYITLLLYLGANTNWCQEVSENFF